MKARIFVPALLIGAVAISSAWLVRPDGTGYVRQEDAMSVLGLDLTDSADVAAYKAMVQNGEVDVNLTREATYDVPCTRDGGQTYKLFQRSLRIDSDMNYVLNKTNNAIRITGYGAGDVQNNVYCPGSYSRLLDQDGLIYPALMTSATYTLRLNGVEMPMEMDPNRRPLP